ncbi:MAG: ABC transporter ATP-binding protein [Alphaproteobacteria bacterium]|nr:ABC transporter ATP-binding protein [Alphaproteobacteria bacterium]
MALVEARAIEKRFSGVVAVKDVDLLVAEGELLGLFGPNGAGKTTMFNIIAGAVRPTAGAVRFRGVDITAVPAFRRARMGIGRTFQVVRPFRGLTVMENLMAAVPSAAARDGRPADLAALLRGVGLEKRANDPAAALTLGMLKRLEVARALALSPQLLLLDEPLAGLSDRECADMLQFVATVRRSITIVMVEHNVHLALPICDRAVVMDAGSIIAEGTPGEIRKNPAVIRAYLGEDAA